MLHLVFLSIIVFVFAKLQTFIVICNNHKLTICENKQFISVLPCYLGKLKEKWLFDELIDAFFCLLWQKHLQMRLVWFPLAEA
ncbi:MAG TPA: hypothetical protein DEQ17_00360 [Prevotella sp.]|nr:hypothetical protein [Prevotella sp.]